MKYPIGIQSFSEIRENGYVYVDKTRFVHTLVTRGKYYFLSRPRRFGKSLLLSTIEAVFKGRRNLFKGLYIDSTDWEWEEYPVIHVDLNVRDYKDETSLKTKLAYEVERFEKIYGIEKSTDIVEDRFSNLIINLKNKTGKNVVVLVDEYDKPLLSALHDEEKKYRFRSILQAFYGVLKSLDPYIKFGMLTGVTRFSKVSVFSGLNNLGDISMLPQYNAICGITETELSDNFDEGIRDLAEAENVSEKDIHDLLKKNYDGYHFSEKLEDIYNPFSLLRTFDTKKFDSYWFASGTPTFLVRLLEKSRFPIPEMEDYRCSEDLLTGSDVYLTDPVPIFFQSGYLTIKGYDKEFRQYTLGFPNIEVAQGFSKFLMKSYMHSDSYSSFIADFVRDVRMGKPEEFMEKLKSFLAGVPYDHIKGTVEMHFENVIYIIFKLMGFYVHTEFRTSDGRIDMVVETHDFVYIIEFKINSTPAMALKQIIQKEYSLPFMSSGKKIFEIGANFSAKSRRMTGFKINTL